MLKKLFLTHLAPTSFNPLCLEIIKAKGVYLFDKNGNKYLDAISGINVSHIGHCNNYVSKKIKQQLDVYSHLMVYGELVLSPQVKFAKLLSENLPKNLSNIYFTNSGSEAVEAAMKLAKRHTKRTKIICFKNSYHGSTQGALSIMGDEYWRNAFRPLLPDIFHCDYNDIEAINLIDEKTSCVILEPIQAEAGIIKANKKWLQKIAEKCKQTKTLLIFDEIQTAFFRTGKLWAWQHYNIKPDVLLLGKALGGGLPLAAVISSKKILSAFAFNPVLGHITTFGGNAISCQAGLAAFEFLLKKEIVNNLKTTIPFFIENLLKLKSPKIKNINHFGLWASIKVENPEQCLNIVQKSLKNNLFIDWFLFANDSLRIAPPLTINKKQILELFKSLQKSL